MRHAQDAEDALEHEIQELSEAIKALGEDSAVSNRLFVTDDDITSLPCFLHDTIFAVKVGSLRQTLKDTHTLYHTPKRLPIGRFAASAAMCVSAVRVCGVLGLGP